MGYSKLQLTVFLSDSISFKALYINLAKVLEPQEGAKLYLCVTLICIKLSLICDNLEFYCSGMTELWRHINCRNYYYHYLFACKIRGSLRLGTLLSFCASVNLTDYYIGEHERDFICSQAEDSGMTKCTDLPEYLYNGRRCNGSALPHGTSLPTNGSCVNWNQFYTLCKPVGSNPFQGAISFDNIGLAWVAIFQVSRIRFFGCFSVSKWLSFIHSFKNISLLRGNYSEAWSSDSFRCCILYRLNDFQGPSIKYVTLALWTAPSIYIIYRRSFLVRRL